MKFDNPIFLFIVGQILTAAGTYAAIRADLAQAIVMANQALHQAEQAHQRIDRIQEQRR